MRSQVSIMLSEVPSCSEDLTTRGKGPLVLRGPFHALRGPRQAGRGPFTDSEVGGLFGISEQRTSVSRSKDPAARFGTPW